MDEQHLKASQVTTSSFRTHQHQFGLSASFLSRLFLLCWFAILLCSFLAWPQWTSLIFLGIQLLLVLLTLGLLLYCWRKLTVWQCCLSLNHLGSITLSEHGLSAARVVLSRPAMVSTLVCVVFFQDVKSGEKRWLWIWHDMLTDTEYRTLCRLLLQLKIA